MIKRIAIYNLLILMMLLACKKEEEVVYKSGTTLLIEIKDEDGEVIQDETTVYLYTDYDQYIKDLSSENPLHSTYQTISSKGIATFTDIIADQIYYIYINYQGKSYQLNNFYSQYVLENPLLADATTSLSIQLTPFNVGEIAFWTDQVNLANTGIQIFIEDSLIGTLHGVKNTVPTDINDKEVLPVFYQKDGTYNIQAKAANGCYWSQTITVSKGQLLPVKLSTCDFGSVMFWANSSVIAANGELTVHINEQEVNRLSVGRSTAPTTCDNTATDYLTIERPTGKYTYKIDSENSDCVWVGTFTVTEGCGQAIELTNCQ